MNEGKIKVSACIITYNHEKYIAQAIEGALSQKLEFSYEIVIGEDCSNDRTRKIVMEYQKKYPDKIRILLNERNLGMIGNWVNTINACKGEYIAILEGDDYWTAPEKLQKQVDFLDNHPDFTISSHNAKVVDEDRPEKTTEWLGKKNLEIIDLEHLLRYGSGGATCSLVFRNGVFGKFPSWYHKAPSVDWALQILCAQKGKMRYFREPMGIYRRHSRGSRFYAKIEAEKRDANTFALPAKNGLILNEMVNKHFGYKYDRLIRKQNIYYYKFYLKEYLKKFNLFMACRYAFLIVKAWAH